MKAPIKSVFAVALLLAGTQLHLHAQLVADGATVSVSATATNLIGDLIVGTNGSFTSLVITNAGTVTNTGNGIIGQNFMAHTNQVIVTDANSVWFMDGALRLGTLGSFGRLTVANGGRVENGGGNIALNGGMGNVALVTDPGSVWTNRSGLNIGNLGPFNQLIVSNGGAVQSGSILSVGNLGMSNQLLLATGGTAASVSGALGNNENGGGNVAVITDAGSRWTISSELQVGQQSDGNLLLLTNGGRIYSGGGYVGANSIQSGGGSFNTAIITGAGSAWTNGVTFGVGNFGAFNQLTVSNGAVVRNIAQFGNLLVGAQSSSSNNTVLVTGSGSRFSNLDLSSRLIIGRAGRANQLLVRDGGVVETDVGELSQNQEGRNNLALIADPGSLWFCSLELNVGNAGSDNQLTVENGGQVSARGLYLGFADTSSNNMAVVTAGSIIISNQTGTAIADVRRGVLVMNSGSLLTDTLLLTNGTQSQFSFNGGIVQTRSLTRDNGAQLLVGDGISPATLGLLGNGSHVLAGGLHITNNARLQGGGTLAGDVMISDGGTLEPGASIGSLTILGDLTLANASTNVFELDKLTGTNDNISGLTTVTYGGTLQITNLGGTLIGGDAFKLFAASNYSGAFSQIVPSVPGPGLEWDGGGLSSNGMLRVASAPYILSNPADVSVTVGQNATFAVSAAGSVSMSYQWQFGGTNISGATGTSFTRTNAQLADAGAYTVIVTNYLGSVTSSLAALTVNLPSVAATNLVISQIYGGGGGGGATYRNDFVELFNPTPDPINLDALSLQSTTTTGTTWLAGALSGTVAPYHYYLVQMGSGGVNGAFLPTADATNTINLNAIGGKIALGSSLIPLGISNPVGFAGVIDFVGYGPANAFEGTAPAAGAAVGNNTVSILRKNGGYTDTNDNTNDFATVSPPAPRNSASPANPPVVPVVPPILGTPSFAGGQFQFTVTGTAGTNYVVQASTNIAVAGWLPLFTNASPFLFVDTNAVSATQRFYRAVYNP